MGWLRHISFLVTLAALSFICLLYTLGFFNGSEEVLNMSPREPTNYTTSSVAVWDLLEYESQLLGNLEEYGNELMSKAQLVLRAVEELRTEHVKAMSRQHEYLANPLNMVRLLRRMHMDWNNWELFMQQSVGSKQISVIKDYRSKFPDDDDFQDAAIAICRLSETYALKEIDIAQGILNGSQLDTKLDAIDCYAMAKALERGGKHDKALLWAHTASEIFEEAKINTVHQISRSSLDELQAKLLRQLNDGDFISDTKHGEDLLEHTKALKQTSLEYPTPFERACRGNLSIKPSRMLCRYNHTTTPFLRLAPLKMEVVLLDPYMVIYHEVVNDNEIETLKNVSTPLLRRSKVVRDTDKTFSQYRTAHSAWLYDNVNDVVQRLNQRIADMTGFDLRESEAIHTVNYGLGGHYNVHHDYLSENPSFKLNNRLATVLFYLSDVGHGGSTVFPKLGISVKPRKGTALLWYNLNNRGEGNPLTLHASCPVLYGNKWIFTKWIRARNQVFRLPCLKEDTTELD